MAEVIGQHGAIHRITSLNGDFVKLGGFFEWSLEFKNGIADVTKFGTSEREFMSFGDAVIDPDTRYSVDAVLHGFWQSQLDEPNMPQAGDLVWVYLSTDYADLFPNNFGYAYNVTGVISSVNISTDPESIVGNVIHLTGYANNDILLDQF